MYCKYCGTPISDTSKFCPQCGKKVELENITENYVDCYCDICGAKYKKEDTVCPVCGYFLERPFNSAAIPKEKNAAAGVFDMQFSASASVPDSRVDNAVTDINGSMFSESSPVPASKEENAAIGVCDTRLPAEVPELHSKEDDCAPNKDIMDFLQLDEFIFDEKLSVFKFTNAYLVYDMNGNVAGAVEQEGVSAGAAVTRLAFGKKTKAFQKFKLNLLMPDGTKFASIYRDGGALAGIYVTDADDKIVSVMKLRFGAFKDNNGNTVCRFSPGFADCKLKDAKGNFLANIHWKINAKALLTTADKYHITISSSLKGEQRLIAGCICVAYDLLSGD